jgi:hypothetical protein
MLHETKTQIQKLKTLHRHSLFHGTATDEAVLMNTGLVSTVDVSWRVESLWVQFHTPWGESWLKPAT